MMVNFGDRVKFKDQSQVHPDLRDKTYCLIGKSKSKEAFALILWEKRGQYQFEFYSGNADELLVCVEWKEE